MHRFVFAQTGTLSDWSVVEKIKTDEQLVVKQTNGKEIKGKMIEATPTALTIDRNGKPQTIARSEIREIHVIARKAEKAKWALIGAGVGAGAGAGIGATKYSSDSDDSEIYIRWVCS